MIDSMRNWWANHSAGERRLMAGLGILILIVVFWLGVWRPVDEGLATGWARQGAALDRYQSVEAKVAALKRLPAPGQGARTPIEQLVSQTATEAGFTLDRVGSQGSGRMSISIAAAKMNALLGWLSQLEAQGVSVQTISIVPGATDGTVSVQAVLQERPA
ncbi:MAG: type II secretion system protein M [Sphingobium sp.]|nr:type II secretion system protein M [Sphingobium sp.]